ncbi:hypothetical protein [Zooshikella sp. RANM57]|uniref:hypothetical protein n=1 Tax=Zooshikella sp. RANM57 TaxID=3425863 RepID=UPI003D6EA833
MKTTTTKQERLEAVNELIKVIATCGRRFFSETSDNKPFISYMEIDERGRIWFIDSWTKKPVYTHYHGEWRHFSNGGTLRRLVESFKNHIIKGTQLNAGYFEPVINDYLTDIWGYGEDILIVKEAAIRLGIAA